MRDSHIEVFMQHQQSMVPSKPLGGFKSSTKPEDKPAEPAKYNQMAPPMTAYTAEYALAKASAAMEGSYQQVLLFDSLAALSCCRMPGKQQLEKHLMARHSGKS